ncbi:MAG: response regulator transcription factor [Firmicutes bacterium]|nr:response regulator transcription factor [Bacillota bacterium]
MHLILQGHTNAHITKEMTISKDTVKKHVSSILRKGNCSSRSELTSRSLLQKKSAL